MFPQRRSIRLRGWDYAQTAFYFLTICTYGRANILGNIEGGTMQLSALGEIASEEWQRSGALRPHLTLDEFVIMPNHVHGIVGIEGRDLHEMDRATGRSPLRPPESLASRSLGAFIAGFKGTAGKRINQLRRTPGKPCWQRGYYDHIIRDLPDLYRLRRYIAQNPLKWHLDRLLLDS